MKVGVTTSEIVRDFGRMDVRFLMLLHAHMPVVAELLTTFTHAELVDLAMKLPVDVDAARTVTARNTLALEAWINSSKTRTNNIAVYVAAASAGLAARIKEQREELVKQMLALEEQLGSICELALAHKADLLFAAIRRGS